MKLLVKRYSESKLNGGSTLGLLFIDGAWECYTLEDQSHEPKMAGKTRIPEGKYKIALRKFGRHHDRYLRRFPDFHAGMLQITGVPGFTDVLIHIGNNSGDTDGCLLVGDRPNNNIADMGIIEESAWAYERVYKKVVAPLLRDEQVTIVFERL